MPGLSVSLTFGGRRVPVDGFGIPLVVRYLLEMCQTTAEAQEILARLPYHLATNHQGFVEWPEQARATRTLEREQRILELLHAPSVTAEGFANAFLTDALYSQAYERGFGTLNTAVYRPAESRAEYRWPGFIWPQSFAAFSQGTHDETLAEGSVA
jgi:predicted choloylglycine hydrolase